MYGSWMEVGREELMCGIVSRIRVVRTEVRERNMMQSMVFDLANTELQDLRNIWAMISGDLVF
jgi:hypothetical protein